MFPGNTLCLNPESNLIKLSWEMSILKRRRRRDKIAIIISKVEKMKMMEIGEKIGIIICHTISALPPTL